MPETERMAVTDALIFAAEMRFARRSRSLLSWTRSWKEYVSEAAMRPLRSHPRNCPDGCAGYAARPDGYTGSQGEPFLLGVVETPPLEAIMRIGERGYKGLSVKIRG